MTTGNHYQILGVKRGCSDEDIKKAYRNLAKQFHPDKNKDPDAEEKFKRIVQAYDILKDADSRQSYDLDLKTFELRRQKQERDKAKTTATTSNGPKPFSYQSRNPSDQSTYDFGNGKFKFKFSFSGAGEPNASSSQRNSTFNESKNSANTKRPRMFQGGHFGFEDCPDSEFFFDDFTFSFSSFGGGGRHRGKFPSSSFSSGDSDFLFGSTFDHFSKLFDDFFDDHDGGATGHDGIHFSSKRATSGRGGRGNSKWKKSPFTIDPDSFEYESDNEVIILICPRCRTGYNKNQKLQHEVVCQELPETHFEAPRNGRRHSMFTKSSSRYNESPEAWQELNHRSRNTRATAGGGQSWRHQHDAFVNAVRHARKSAARSSDNPDIMNCIRCSKSFVASSHLDKPYCINCLDDNSLTHEDSQNRGQSTPRHQPRTSQQTRYDSPSPPSSDRSTSSRTAAAGGGSSGGGGRRGGGAGGDYDYNRSSNIPGRSSPHLNTRTNIGTNSSPSNRTGGAYQKTNRDQFPNLNNNGSNFSKRTGGVGGYTRGESDGSSAGKTGATGAGTVNANQSHSSPSSYSSKFSSGGAYSHHRGTASGGGGNATYKSNTNLTGGNSAPFPRYPSSPRTPRYTTNNSSGSQTSSAYSASRPGRTGDGGDTTEPSREYTKYTGRIPHFRE